MSGRRGPNWRLLERIVPVIGMMTGILQRPSLLQRTQRPCSEEAGPPTEHEASDAGSRPIVSGFNRVYDNFVSIQGCLLPVGFMLQAGRRRGAAGARVCRLGRH